MFNKKNVLKYLAEGVLIILSILIAFSLENWRQGKAAKKRQNAILTEIKNELLIDVVLIETLIENSKQLESDLKNANSIIENKNVGKFDSLIYYLMGVESAFTSSTSIRDSPDLMLQTIEHIKREDISVPLRQYYKFNRGKLSFMVENYQQKRYELLSIYLNKNYDRSIDLFNQTSADHKAKNAAINKNNFYNRELQNNLAYLGSQSIHIPWLEEGRDKAKKIAKRIKSIK